MFANNSIRIQLSLLLLLTVSSALTLAGVALFKFESYQQSTAVMRELSAMAGVIAENSTAALMFGDEQSATQMMAALRADSLVVDAVVYTNDGRPFARYQPAGRSALTDIPRIRPPGVYVENGVLLMFRPIQLNGATIGTIFLRGSMDEMYSRLNNYVGIVCLVLLVSLVLSLVLGDRMQTTVTRPIRDLSEVARQISSEKDYSVRAVKQANNEVGFLVDSFNQMLTQIEMREQARQAAEKSLRESEERYALAARGANDGLWDWKLTTGEVYFSSRWTQMLGYQESEIGSTPEEWLERIHPSDRDRVKSQIAAHCHGRTAEFVSEYRMQRHNGAFAWMLSRGIAIRDAEGKAIRMAGSQTDITEGKVGDPLTGLPNRLYLIDKLENAVDSFARGGKPFAILFLDLDRFKLVNDTLGHAAGDELLVEVAGRLCAAARAADCLASRTGNPSTVARLGGDEFVVLLNEIYAKEDAIEVAERILKSLATSIFVDGCQAFVSVSVGIALCDSVSRPEDLLRNADTAMYHAKTNGKGRVEIFDERMRERAIARAEIESGLRKAIDAGELIVHYQAQVSTRTQRITGYEALVRWNHPLRGLLGPGEFIPIAEESDLIVRVGRWVLREACKQMVEWQRTVTTAPLLTISVNVSTKELGETGFVEAVQQTLQQTGLNPACLKLEITEGSIMGNRENALITLKRLKALHVSLEIDDFGTGYSSLSYLQKLPFDTVKIDRSFVRELGTNAESSEIVKTILELAHSLRMTVVAEGVETGEQVDMLQRLGCSSVQGFYFSKPLSPQEAMTLLLERDNMRRAFDSIPSQQPSVTLASPESMTCLV